MTLFLATVALLNTLHLPIKTRFKINYVHIFINASLIETFAYQSVIDQKQRRQNG